MNAELQNNETVISVSGLKKSFGSVEVLKGIDIDIHKGDVLCVIGASGSGKSTFLRCLNLLEKPTGGSIIFDGDDLMAKKVDLNLHRQKMGMVFQQFNLFPHLTILKNLTIGPMMLKKIPKAEAEADQLTQNAEYLKQKRINEAYEQVARFNAMYQEYKLNPEVTKSRMYYETIAKVLPGVKVYINTGDGDNIDMMLPLEGFVEGGDQ